MKHIKSINEWSSVQLPLQGQPIQGIQKTSPGVSGKPIKLISSEDVPGGTAVEIETAVIRKRHKNSVLGVKLYIVVSKMNNNIIIDLCDARDDQELKELLEYSGNFNDVVGFQAIGEYFSMHPKGNYPRVAITSPIQGEGGGNFYIVSWEDGDSDQLVVELWGGSDENDVQSRWSDLHAYTTYDDENLKIQRVGSFISTGRFWK
jgi:hypothetical protein